MITPLSPPLIFVCSPFRASTTHSLGYHIAYAKKASLLIFQQGAVPFTPHLLYPSYLNDNNPAHRDMGIAAGLAILSRCTALHAFIDHGISEGMAMEIEAAEVMGIPVAKRNLFPAPADSP